MQQTQMMIFPWPKLMEIFTLSIKIIPINLKNNIIAQIPAIPRIFYWYLLTNSQLTHLSPIQSYYYSIKHRQIHLQWLLNLPRQVLILIWIITRPLLFSLEKLAITSRNIIINYFILIKFYYSDFINRFWVNLCFHSQLIH